MVDGAQIAVLVVDDDTDLRFLLSESLAGMGFAVESAHGANEALVRLKERSFAVVLTDIRMPKVSGLDLLRAIKETFADAPPVILMSGYSDISRQHARELGAVDLLLKPFDVSDMVQLIRRSAVKHA